MRNFSRGNIKKNSFLLLALVLFLLLLSSFSFAAFQKTSSLGLPSNTARIFDFNNDGENEILAFSDKIDSTLATISYYVQLSNGTYALNQTITPSGINVSRCSLSYNDLDKDGYLDIVYYCLNNTSIISGISSFDGTKFVQKEYRVAGFGPYYYSGGGFNYSSSTVGDTLFYDFNNDGYADILSCFDITGNLGDATFKDKLKLKVSLGDVNDDGNIVFQNYSSGINVNRFVDSNGLISSCNLLSLDYDSDGDLDVIAYNYDANNFSLYNNTLCNLTSCKNVSVDNYANAFQEVPFTDFVNTNFFNSSTKIKYLKVFDSNSDGYSDLYYIVDNGVFTDPSSISCTSSDASTGCRNITFGNFINQHRRMTQKSNVSQVSFNSFNYSLGYKYVNFTNFTGINQNGVDDLYSLSLSSGIEIFDGSNNGLNGLLLKNQTSSVYYNINLENFKSDGSLNKILFSGDYFLNSYDYNVNFGNLLTRNKVNLKLSNQCLNATAQAIAPSQLQSGLSYYQFKNNVDYSLQNGTLLHQFLEFCDGLDNDCDGVVDNSFNFTWPDNNVSVFSFDEDGDSHAPLTKTFSHSNWTVSFDCSARKITENNLLDGIRYWDSNDNDNTEWCSYRDATLCGPKYKTRSTDNSGGGSTTIVDVPKITNKTIIVRNDTPTNDTEIEIPDNSTVIPPELPPVIPPSVDEPSGDTGDKDKGHVVKISSNYIQEITFGAIRVIREIQYVDGNTILVETIKNLGAFDSKGVSLRVTIPKEIVSSARDIKVLNEFSIVEDDPVIEFDLGNLSSGNNKVIQYKIEGKLSEDLLDRISTTIITKNLSTQEQATAIADLNKQISDTAKAVNITVSSQVVGNKTILTVNLDVNKSSSLSNVSIYQEVPKCLIKIINELVATSDKKFEIVESDPLIVWHFDKLVDSQQIQLEIAGVAGEDCLNQAKTMAIAKEIIFSTAKINYVNLWLAILLIPLIALFIIIISEFSNSRAHDDKEINDLINYIKKHYRTGMSEQDIVVKLLMEGYERAEIEKAIKLNSKTWLHFLIQKVDFGIHELILVVFIFLDVLDLLNLLPQDVDYFKKIVSWALLGYLVYRISITDVVNGNRRKWIDVTLIMLFFIMTLKNLVGAAKSSLSSIGGENLSEAKFIAFDLYNYIVLHNDVFERYLFIAGFIGVLAVAFIIARDKVKDPSALSSFKLDNYFVRVFANCIALLAFFVVVFNLIFEWLAIVVDAFITFAIVIAIIIILIKHKHRFGFEKIVEDMSGKAESFYEEFVSLFHYKRFIPLALSGMLILYVLTEICNFLIPYMIGLKSEIYFGSLGSEGRLPLFMLSSFSNFVQSFFDPSQSLFAFQTHGASLLLCLVIAVSYILNLIGLLYLLFLPGIVWYDKFKQKEKSLGEHLRVKLSLFHIWLFSFSVVVFILRPVFTLAQIRVSDIISDTQKLVGVDFLTHAIKLDYLMYIVLFALVISLVITFIAYIGQKFEKKFQEIITDFLLLGSFLFFTYYVFIFMSAQYSYYLNVIIARQGIIAFAMILFAILNFVLLYGLGYLFLLFTYISLEAQLKVSQSRLFSGIFGSQNFSHIHYRDDHDLIEHGTHHEKLVSYIKNSVELGHELYNVIDHLIVHGWKIEEIERAVHEAIPDEKLHEGFDHYHHYHHNREIIDALHAYIKKHYYHGSYRFEIKKLIDFISDISFNADEVISALSKQNVKLDRKYEPNAKLFANYVNLHKAHLVGCIKLAEDSNYSKEFILYSMKHVPTTINHYGELLVPVAKQMLHKKVTEIADELLKFQFSEDDIRVALKNIKAMSDEDEEVLKYV